MDNTKKFATELTDIIATYMDENGILEEGANLTEFFTGLLVATGIIYHTSTGNNADLIETISVLNRLAFMHITKFQDESDE
jgi:hypothetical protein